MEGPEAVHLRVVSDYDAPDSIDLTKDPFYYASSAIQHSALRCASLWNELLQRM
jgi:hypothetical protein